MKSIPFTEFKLLKAEDLKKSKSFRVNFNGDLMFMVIIPQGEKLVANYLLHQVEDLVEVNNNFGNKEV